MSLIKNKKVLITAGASGIGWATAKILSQRGARVFICDVDRNKINKINKDKKNNIKAYLCDVDEKNEVERFFDQIKKSIKKIDCLINNVGIAGPTGSIENLNSENWSQTLKTNVISHFLFTKNSIPMLKKNKGGSIINISSGAGIMGFPLRSPYAASKWAIIGVTKTLAMELGKFKIRVNAICPGTIKGNRMVRVIRDKSKFLKIPKKKIEKEFISMASMNCWIYEDDIGKACSFLISNDSERISGQTIPIDGNAIRLD